MTVSFTRREIGTGIHRGKKAYRYRQGGHLQAKERDLEKINPADTWISD